MDEISDRNRFKWNSYQMNCYKEVRENKVAFEEEGVQRNRVNSLYSKVRSPSYFITNEIIRRQE